MTSNILYKRNKISWDKIDEQIIIVNSKIAKAHELNIVGSFIWESLEYSRTLEELAILISDNFEIKEADLKVDLEKFIKKMLRNELIIISN